MIDPQEPTGWQPISSAPTTGFFLAHAAGKKVPFVISAEIYRKGLSAPAPVGTWHITHWHPLPDLPLDPPASEAAPEGTA